MCEQCVAQSVPLVENVLPGIHLHQAKAGSAHWPKDWYGLVAVNDPMLVFPGPLVKDLSRGLSDEELDSAAPEGFHAFLAATERLDEKLASLHAMVGYELVSACVQAGYDPKQDGYEVSFWLAHHLASRLEERSNS